MDRKKLILTHKISGSTLMEVIIAMVCIIVIFGIALMIYGNVLTTSISIKKIKATGVLNDIMQKAVTQQDELQNQNFTFEDLYIEQQIKPYHGEEKLIELDLSAYDQNRQLLTTERQIILARNAQR